MTKSIYLDHAAATPVAPEVLAAMHPYYSGQFYNPSATYAAAKSVASDVKAARAKVARILGTRPSEIVFTAGGTEANNLAIHGVMSQYPDANLVVSTIEHDSVLAAAKRHQVRLAAVDERGIVDTSALEQLIDERTALVSIMYANNEIGTVQPLREIARSIESIRKQRRQDGNKLPLLLHTDAAQAANYLDLHVARLGVDLMTLNGGKIYGPKQSGALYVKAGVMLSPLIDGGGQEMGLRSGTENVPGVIGFATALELSQAIRHDEVSRLQKLQADFIASLTTTVPSLRLNGSKTRRLPNNVHVTFPGIDNERLLIQLDEAGIMAAAGSACSASSELPSHVLHALGLTDQAAQSSVRFTLGRATTQHDLETVVQTLAKLLA
ncbi:cysteine desulfurase NifS [soil metagenome]